MRTVHIDKLAFSRDSIPDDILCFIHDPLNRGNRNVASAENLALPTIDDIREGTIITRIAAHAIDLVKPGVRDRAHSMDRQMAIARKNLDWAAQFECAIDGTRARLIHDARGSGGYACSMCGEMCAIKVARDALDALMNIQ